MSRRGWVLAALLACVPVFDTRAQPRAERAYLGLSLRQTDEGPVVSWVRPGPLGGRGFTSTSGVRRGDNLVALDGESVSAESFREAIEAAAPGTRVTLTFRRSPEADASGSIARGGSGGESFDVVCELSDLDTWSGTIGLGLGDRALPPLPESAFAEMIRTEADTHGILSHPAGLDALIDSIAGVQNESLDPLSLPCVVHALRQPLRLDAVETGIAARVDRLRALSPTPAEGDMQLIAEIIAQTLGYVPPIDAPEIAGEQLPSDLPERSRALVQQMRNDWSIQTDRAGDHLSVIRFAGDNAGNMLAGTLHRLVEEARSWERTCAGVSDPLSAIGDADLPEGFRDAVTGDVYRVRVEADGRWSVHGGPGPNTYDTTRLAFLYDAGGDDVYTAEAPAPAGAARTSADSVIIDQAGNDTYSSRIPFMGPGTAAFGYALVDDRAGDDRYESTAASTLGAALFGIGIILDRAGNDTYANRGPDAGFSLGSGFYGSGLILDLGGRDTYIGEKLCQGIGAAGGFGAIVDFAGDDLYRANGPAFPSAYGTPGVFLGMSQGFGFGIRGYAAGGLGAIYDLAGNDRYEAGEFSQGGGYFFGLGVLHDRGGRDLYYGNRYGQAFAAHQAAGILVDHAGDDTYWSMTAASQSGAWDQSATLLLDHAGDDTYRCDGLGIAGAAMQSIAIAIDLAGDDAYHAAGNDTLGRSGANTYHFDADRVMSFSCLLDADGVDRYPFGSPMGNGRVHAVPVPSPEEISGNTRIFGLFIDTQDPAPEQPSR